jgi:endoglucanase
MRARVVGVAAVGLLATSLALHPRSLDAARRVAKRALGYPAWRERAARPEEPPFQRLAASQVGYAPSMAKRFSSPREFRSFRVVTEPERHVAFQGGPPVRAVRTDVLGSTRIVWIGDFTPVQARGRYRIVTDDGLESHPFDVRADVYDDAVRAVQRALYFQRAFTAIDAAHAEGPWVHASDAGKAPAGEEKGWHDAGDFSIYNASATVALFWLLQSYDDFSPVADDTNIPESGNGVPDLLDEARWGLEWMLSVQEPSGGFRNVTCQERYGPYGTNAPERAARYRSGEVGTIATGRAVGTLARASVSFRRHDPAFAQRCLEAAARGFGYLAAHPAESTDGPTCPAMRQDGDARTGRDVRMYAAAGMLLATGEPRFRGEFEANYEPITGDPSFRRTNVYAALLYLRADAGDPERKRVIQAALRHHAELARADGDAHPFEWAGRYFWGSIAAGFQRTAAFNVRGCLDEGRQADCDQALANVHYALGRNLRQFCYVSGLGGVTNGRTHAFHHWLAALRAEPLLFPGLVAGGPSDSPERDDISVPHARPLPVWGYWGDPAMPRDASTPLDGRYTDNESWSTNELDVEWQGAALYGLSFAQWWAKRLPSPPAAAHPSGEASPATR